MIDQRKHEDRVALRINSVTDKMCLLFLQTEAFTVEPAGHKELSNLTLTYKTTN